MRSKNDVAWEALFHDHQILDHVESHGVYQVSSTTINEFREARLMTKFDHQIQLPAIFKQNDLTIQPNSRGTYLIGRFDSYLELPSGEEADIEEVPFPSDIETINPQCLFSESAALLCAYNSGIMERLLQESVSLTVMGRMSTGRFDYNINEIRTGEQFQIQVQNSQCEIDSGFEGPRTFAIVEAKNETVNDFLVRQLYYPYRLWEGRTRKEVVPIFLSYSNDVFSFYVFRFVNEADYNSIELVEQRKYQIGTREIELEDIVIALERVRTLPEPSGVPFPQADSFNRVIDLLTQLHGSGVMSQEDVTTNHAFDLRQTQYYTNAGRYLGLIERKQTREDGVTYSLTSRGTTIMARRPAERNLAIAESILEHSVFNGAVRRYLGVGGRVSIEDIVKIMGEANLGLDREGNTTLRRRAQTVHAWVDWMMQLTRR